MLKRLNPFKIPKPTITNHLKKASYHLFFNLSVYLSNCQNETHPQKKEEDGFLRLDHNRVTVKASYDSLVSNIYKLNGVNYKVVNMPYLRRAIANGDNVTYFVTSKVRNMNRFFMMMKISTKILVIGI